MPNSDTRTAYAAIRAPQTLLPSVLQAVGLQNTYVRVSSPLGDVYVAFNDREILEVRETPNFAQPARISTIVPPHLQAAINGDAGALQKLRLPLERLTPFAQAVLRTTATIPRGQVRPYAWVAQQIGNPRAVRAVGTALARNPVPLLIPCHRVVRGDGIIGNYALGGAQNKRRVLAAEGVPEEFLRS